MRDWLFRAFHITDLHSNPLTRVPQSRSATYHADVRCEWDAFAEIVAAERPDAVCMSGDFFNLKNQSLYSPEDILEYRDRVMKFDPVPWYVIPGNHDLPKSSYDLVHTTAYQALCVSTPNMFDAAFRTFVHKADTGGGNELEIHVTGVPYLPLAELFEKLPLLNAELSGMPGMHIVMLHPEAFPRDDLPMHFEYASYDAILDQLPAAHVLLFGHIHMSFPVYDRRSPITGRPQFVSKPWSFGRVVKDYYASADELEHRHKPMFCDITVARDFSVSLTYREIPCVPFEQAFVREALTREIEASGKVVSFIQQLRQDHGSLDDAFAIERPEDFLQRARMPDRIRDIIHQHLNG